MKTDVFLAVNQMAEEVGSLYRDKCTCRDDLLGFFDRNAWFDQIPEWCNGKVFLPDLASVSDQVRVWLRAYKRTNEEKLEILLETGSGICPKTCKKYMDFVCERGIADKPSGWKILDFILAFSDGEITKLSDTELNGVLEKTRKHLPAVTTSFFMDFISQYVQSEKYGYEVHSRKMKEQSKEAYAFKDYSIMAYFVFNEKVWKEQQLIEKAVVSKKCANLWLFVAFHFLGALRQTDLVRLPKPELPNTIKKTRQLLVCGEYSSHDAMRVAEEFQLLLKYQPYIPNKTARYAGIPEIKLFIPESLKVPMGVILSTVLTHATEQDTLVHPVHDLVTIRKFFGESFADALGNRRFATRKANKAYLQGIELVAGNEPGRPKGYILAALARSHKGGIGTLPEITDLYLKDAAFSGHSPEFILREMFERGIMGFIPAMLLEKYSGEKYKKLPVKKQTEIIKAVGLEAYQIEEISRTVHKATVKALALVDAFTKEDIGSVLQKIASGAAPGKQEDMLCVRIAAGYGCSDPVRSSCIGCGYEIYTKAAFHILMKEYVRFTECKKNSTGFERMRYQNLLEKGLMPVIIQIVESLPVLYPGASMETILEMLERGMAYADQISG